MCPCDYIFDLFWSNNPSKVNNLLQRKFVVFATLINIRNLYYYNGNCMRQFVYRMSVYYVFCSLNNVPLLHFPCVTLVLIKSNFRNCPCLYMEIVQNSIWRYVNISLLWNRSSWIKYNCEDFHKTRFAFVPYFCRSFFPAHDDFGRHRDFLNSFLVLCNIFIDYTLSKYV